MPERLYALKGAPLLLGLHPHTIQKRGCEGVGRQEDTGIRSEMRRLQGEMGRSIRGAMG